NSLFVNGQRAIRARTPNEGLYYSFSSFFEQPELKEPCAITESGTCTPFTAFVFNDGNLRASWNNLNDGEIVFQTSFTQPRFRIKTVDEANKVVSIDSLEAYHSGALPPLENWEFYYYWKAPLGKYHVENVLEALDSAGEWYFDRTTANLYYKPRLGEDLNNPATEIVIPILDQLLTVQRDFDELALPESFTISHRIKTADPTFYTLSNTGGYDGYSFGLSGGKIHLIIGEGESPGEYTDMACSPPAGVTINDDQWHLISGVVRRGRTVSANNQFTCYVDGTKGEDVPLPSAYTNMQKRTPFINPFPCATCTVAIDELSLYNRELTDAEIGSLSAGDVPRDGLLLSLPFEENLKDNSGSLRLLQKRDGGAPEFTAGTGAGKALIFGRQVNADEIVFSLDVARQVHFKDLTFQYTDWNLPPEGYAGSQAAMKDKNVPAINFYLAEDASFENNKVLHTGSYGLAVYGKDVKGSGNDFFDMGSGGLKIGHPDNNALVGSKKQIVYEGGSNDISRNKINGVGKVNPEGVGIIALLSGNNRISHNEISDASYSGISVGWNWGVLNTAAKNNSITYNNIHDVMQVLSDGSGIYTLGKQPGTVISNNFVHDYVYDPQKHINLVAGIYLDEGSSDMIIKDNLIYRAGATSLVMGWGFDRQMENNVFIDAQNSQDVWHGQLYLFPNGYCGPGTSREICPSGNTLSRNIIYSADPEGKVSTVHSEEGIQFSKNLLYNPNKDWNSLEQNFSCADCLIADPQFKALSQDFTLTPGSPAFTLGFREFDVQQDVRVAGSGR
ncbi:MAG TPA: right-handed parallel beta-helix repeat-containing protein, partial [Candidatus Nanoarchaeia archaeon]|nr:right-handed parallel beta-helix repeat-containing protein [Candidatus Nanoarchaeia archaeon]